MKEAMFYEKLKNGRVRCRLCARECKIPKGGRGACGVRKNENGTLYALTYAKPCSVAVDPIEKKPLYNFYPGSRTFSIATVGCNFHCEYCQNWTISQASPEPSDELSPEQVVQQTLDAECQGVSYTYTEPTIFYEYAYDTSKLAKKKGLYNVFVSNGYINEEPLKEISQYLDAMNMDLKAFSDEFYQKLCKVPSVEPVKETAKNCRKFGIHLEITNLIIPGWNDDERLIRELVIFVRDEVGKDTPLHFSRFYPHYKMTDMPPTEVESVERARKIALEEGLEYVYCGNVPPGRESENTYCPKCHALLIERFGYSIERMTLKDGQCAECGKKINIVM